MSAFFRRHAATVWLATALLVVLGIASARQLPSGIYPEVEFPRIVVVAKTGGANPDVFLTTVTRPLEQQLVTVIGVQRVRSRTIRGATEISLQFAPATDMWRALQLVESRVNEARADLPAGTEIIVERVTTGSFPVVTFNVSGAVDPRELRELADFVVRPALGNVKGVGRIEVLGGDVREVEVVLDADVLASLNLTPNDIATKLQSAFGIAAVGRALDGKQSITVVADAQPKTLDGIRAIPIMTTAAGGVITLGEVAEVAEGAADRVVRVGGPRGETVVVSVARMPGASTPDVVKGTLDAVKALSPTLPKDVHVEPVYDQASLVNESMANVRDAILLGIALCAVVIGVFLRDLRAGLVAGLSVPCTLAITFVAMRVANQTLNLMSLGGMAVAVGLVVDDAIVMIEAIARRAELGDDPHEAATRGIREIGPAVAGTTITTVVVFVPLAFLQGVVGDFFRALAFTVTTAVLVSLVVAVVLVPLAPRGRPRAGDRTTRIAQLYERPLRWIMKRRWAVPAALVATVAMLVALIPRLERGFLPTMDEGAFVLDYFLPAGTSLEATEQYAKLLERELRSTPEIETYSRRTGAELGPAAATHANRGDIMVRLVPRSSRHRGADEVIADVRGRIEHAVPEARVEFVQVLQDVLNDLSGNPRPIEVKFFGPDHAKLHEIAARAAQQMKGVEGVVDLYAGEERAVPEMRFVVNRDATARFGVTPNDVSAQLDVALQGRVLGSVRRFDRLVGVRARYPNPVRYDRSHILTLPFAARDHVTTFASVADVATTTTSPELLHEALQPMVAVTGDHEGRGLGAVADDVDRIVGSLDLPPGYRVEIGGQAAAAAATRRELLGVAVIALLLVLTVLAAQFRRLRLAGLVMATVPFAMLGAVLTLVVTHVPLNASSMMGMVLLVGLVVKNGVLLLEHAERSIEEGHPPDEAVRLAGDRRVRPILMTTLATLAGLAPLALGFGAGAELQRPLAIAVMGGLVTSTAATLLLIPPVAAALLRSRAPRQAE